MGVGKSRISWDEYYMATAHTAALRSSCDRANVGSVIIMNNCIVSQGYNGSIRGTSHCDDEGVGHLMVDGRCVRTAHAEANAIVNAASNGIAISGGIIFVTHFPCWECIKLICNSKLSKVVYDIEYRYKKDVDDMVGLKTLPVEFVQYSITKKE